MFYGMKTSFMEKQVEKRKREKPFDYEKAEAFEIDPDADWTAINSYYFTAHDKETSFYVRLGRRNPYSEAWVHYSGKEGTFTLKKNTFETDCPIEIKKDGENWKVSFKGNLEDESGKEIASSFEGTFTPAIAAVDFTYHMPSIRVAKAMAFEKWNKEYFKAQSKVNQTHYEQYGRIKGTLKVGKQSMEIDLPCLRDHSFGTRDWDFMNNHVWIASVDEDSYLNFSMVSYPTMTLLEVGNYYEKGRPMRYLELCDYDHAAVARGNIPDSLHIRIKLTNGQILEVGVRTLSHVDYPFQGGKYLLREGLAEITVNGKTSRGIFEIGHNLDRSRIYNGHAVGDLKR